MALQSIAPAGRLICMGQIRGQVPIRPTVIAAKGNRIAAGERAGDAHSHGHRFASAAAEPGLLGPRMQGDQPLGQFQLFDTIERAHRTKLDTPHHGISYVGIGITEQAGSNARGGHVAESPTIQVDHFAAAGFAKIGRPAAGAYISGRFASNCVPPGMICLARSYAAAVFAPLACSPMPNIRRALLQKMRSTSSSRRRRV